MSEKYVVKLTENGKQYVVKKIKRKVKKRFIKKSIVNLMNLMDLELFAKEKQLNEHIKYNKIITNLKNDLRKYKKLHALEVDNANIKKSKNKRHKKTPKYKFEPIEITT